MRKVNNTNENRTSEQKTASAVKRTISSGDCLSDEAISM